MKTYTCANRYCQKPFVAKDKNRKYCCMSCRNTGRAKASRDVLRPYAERGVPLTHIARELGMHMSSIDSAIYETGLYPVWRKARWAS